VHVTDNQTSVCACAAGCLRHPAEEGIDAVMQMVCRDRNRIAAQSDILARPRSDHQPALPVRGPSDVRRSPQAKNVFDIDSIQLLKIAKG